MGREIGPWLFLRECMALDLMPCGPWPELKHGPASTPRKSIEGPFDSSSCGRVSSCISEMASHDKATAALEGGTSYAAASSAVGAAILG
jgi:hypothetical protein